MILFKLQIKIHYSRRDEALQLLSSFIGPVTVHPGLTSAEIYNGFNDDELLLLTEWATREDLTHHIQSDDFKKILAVMDIAQEPPEVHFHTVAFSQGFELLESTRGFT